MSEFWVNKDIELLKEALTKQRELRETDYWKNEILGLSPPVLWFGDSNKKEPLVTVGANPSRREFLDSRDGHYLSASKQRFHHLTTANIQEVLRDERTLRKIVESYNRYFHRNPYRSWFGKPKGYKVEGFLNGLGASLYGVKPIGAVHTDLIPFTTKSDFSDLKDHTLKRYLFHNGWAKSFFDKLMEYLVPSAIIVFGRTNVGWFNKYYNNLALNRDYNAHGKRRARYGLSTYRMLERNVPLVGLSVNLGNPRNFTREMLNEFGACIKSKINNAENG
ncbi:hypothetical protein KAR91_15425 [Candidatus Pacearchaeota archaeon]|nr:hypothetical protein [Candidatus Pacearchaeota archaeon]